MFDRIKGSILLLPLIIVLITGGNLLYLAGFVLSLLGLKELYSAFKTKGFNLISGVGVVFCTFILLSNIFKISDAIKMIEYFVLFTYAVVVVILRKHNVVDLSLTILSILYIVIPFECIIKINEVSINSFNMSWIIFIVAFSSDISAYFVGKNLGKHKLIPLVSPNKTIEGSLGGILGSAIVVCIISKIFGFNMILMSTVAVVGSILSQIGDLFASAIKRYAGIKDFSHIIPGHGGIIDRFDSVLFVAPLIFILTFFMSDL